MISFRSMLVTGSLTVALAGCKQSDRTPTGSRDLASIVEGAWTEAVTFPGISLVFSLESQDTVLTGTGTYAIEAGRSGTLIVTGFVSGTTVVLDIVRDFGSTDRFEGGLADRNTLSGVFVAPPAGVSQSSTVVFNRLQR